MDNNEVDNKNIVYTHHRSRNISSFTDGLLQDCYVELSGEPYKDFITLMLQLTDIKSYLMHYNRKKKNADISNLLKRIDAFLGKKKVSGIHSGTEDYDQKSRVVTITRGDNKKYFSKCSENIADKQADRYRDEEFLDNINQLLLLIGEARSYFDENDFPWFDLKSFISIELKNKFSVLLKNTFDNLKPLEA